MSGQTDEAGVGATDWNLQPILGGPDADPARPSFWKAPLAGGLAALFVLVALGAVFYLPSPHGFFGSSPADPGRWVTILVTDLPGGFERVRFSLAAVSVGEELDPLEVELYDVEISSLHGPAAAVEVASGFVPEDAGRSITFTFARAEGWKDDAWQLFDIREADLTIEDSLLDAAEPSHVALFDFNLESSLVFTDTTVRFEPYVAAVYQAAYAQPEVRVDPSTQLGEFTKIEVPPQGLGNRAKEACASASACKSGASASGTKSSDDPGGPPASPTSSSPPPPVPVVSGPNPPNKMTRLSLDPGLRWLGGAGVTGLTYTVRLNGADACVKLVGPPCVVHLNEGTKYTWQVKVQDAYGQTRWGPMWEFTTDHRPGLDPNMNPANNSKGMNDNLYLYFNGTDADPGDGLKYRVYVWEEGEAIKPQDLKCNNIVVGECHVFGLRGDAWYNWHVEVEDEAGLVYQGPDWRFETRIIIGHFVQGV